MYKKNLENDIKSDTSGHFKKVLVSLLTASRPSGNLVDRTQAKLDSEELLNAGTKKWGTDESKFVTILCTRSFSQLRAMFDEYEQLTGHSIEEDLKKECSGDLLRVFLSIVACVRDKQAHFASILLKSMKGLGTKESSLIRVIVGRCEIDLVQIKQKFEQISKKSLAEYIKGDTSGDFRKVLLILIGDEDAIKK
ncbi:annexin A4 [Brachionus plicatilis]|uniref:Annexin n=1 Tax=Brachionus plicatilis TaxID=10195 RepID=A0A3M7PPE9_BRAPC|nr:annexin A4 [Brachionus plicatilis]